MAKIFERSFFFLLKMLQKKGFDFFFELLQKKRMFFCFVFRRGNIERWSVVGKYLLFLFLFPLAFFWTKFFGLAALYLL